MSRKTRTRLGEFTMLRTTANVRQIGGDLDEGRAAIGGDRGFQVLRSVWW